MNKLTVEMMTGSVIDVRVDDEATVADLKRQIVASQKNLPYERLIVLKVGEEDGGSCLMNDERVNLSEYGVGDGCHVYLFLHPKEDMLDDENFFLLFGLPDGQACCSN
ncbi:hypothetical protein QQ045_015897 [Rhodiola kirilowii]